jgi:wobble nucleotide-excising tRNase
MIQKIDIQNFGLFQEYKWNQNIGGDPATDIFKKLNIIYGRNYSGKTTLSRIFRCIEKGELHKNCPDGRFSIINSSGVDITEANLNCSYKVRVYNSDFIKDDLSWLHDNENGEIRAFTLLGSANIAVQKRISEIENELGGIEKKTGLLFEIYEKRQSYSQKVTDISNQREKLYRNIQTYANQKIKNNKYFIKQGIIYDVRNIQDEINDIINRCDLNFILNDDDKIKHKTIIDEDEKRSIGEISIILPNFEEQVTKVKSLVEKKITLSKTLNELVADSLLQNWVDQGRAYHRGKREKCAFCGGDILSDRWEMLDAHFSKESEILKKEIKNEMQILEQLKDTIENILMINKIAKENYYTLLYDEFDEISKKWTIAKNKYIDSIVKLMGILQRRYDDIFNPIMIENNNDFSDEIKDALFSFNSLSKKNNEKTTTLENDKTNSRKALRYSNIASFISTINYIKENKNIEMEKNDLLTPKNNIENIEKKISELEIEMKQEKLKLNDEGEAARKINSHL